MLTDFVEHGPTDKALEAAKNNIMGGFVLRLDSNQKLTEQVAGIAFYHRPLDYLSTYPERIRAVTRDEVKRAFASRIDPKKMQTHTGRWRWQALKKQVGWYWYSVNPPSTFAWERFVKKDAR